MTQKWMLPIVCLLLVTACAGADTPSTSLAADAPILAVHYIDVGQAEATLITWEQDEQAFNMLIDTGDWNDQTTVEYLHEQGIEELDLVVGTHPHADHIGQMADVINEFTVLEAWMSGDETDTLVFERTLDAVLEHEVDYHEPRAGEQVEIGDVTIDVLHPETLNGDLNNGSIVMKLTYGEVSFLFTGDVELQGEEDMLDRGQHLQATVLSMPHHGSNTSSSEPFIEAVQPSYAIYSAGVDNAYDHPGEEALEVVRGTGATIYGTDEVGTIIVSTDGTTVAIQSEREEADCVNINRASVKELEQIAEIGPSRAQQIVDLRPFAALDELTDVDGIGEARLKTIKEEGIACVRQ
ncbi:MBL fold metallo-hydrolase [Shouchella miscanthi]|uniref:MBL fold metallo-hydrolase n=1 Tax=Shouchella miscanthi TaxID=2598861 RepID=A0ABU6NL99_9BACI|nr:MBL fold metallo-hydrolase [Shouchella miscanthi]